MSHFATDMMTDAFTTVCTNLEKEIATRRVNGWKYYDLVKMYTRSTLKDYFFIQNKEKYIKSIFSVRKRRADGEDY